MGINDVLDKSKIGSLNDFTRDKILRVMDGEEKLIPFIYLLTGAKRQVDYYDWMIANNLTGHKLYLWIKNDHNSSLLSMMRYMNSKLEKSEERKVLYGRDF